MKVYITKYALTKGVYKADVELADSQSARSKGIVLKRSGSAWPLYLYKPDWAETLEEAHAQVVNMATNRKASSQGTIRKMEALLLDPLKDIKEWT